MDWDIFTEALSMAKSSNGIGAATRLATTRKKANGNAQKMIDEAAVRNVRVFKTCIFEVMCRCDCVTPGKCDEKYEKYVSYDREGNPKRWVDEV